MTLREQAEALGIKVDGRWNDARIQKEINKFSDDLIVVNGSTGTDGEVIDATAAAPTISVGGELSDMNALALRIWEGQSVSLPIVERVKRIKKALTDKGYDVKGLKLPVEDKYLA